ASIEAARRDDHGVTAHRARPGEWHRELGERDVVDVRVLRMAYRELQLRGRHDPVAEHDELARLLRLDREAERRRVDDREEGAAIRDVDGTRAKALDVELGAQMCRETRDVRELDALHLAVAAARLY